MGGGVISPKIIFLPPPPSFFPKMFSYLLKLVQIWQFQHKNDIFFLYILPLQIFLPLCSPYFDAATTESLAALITQGYLQSQSL